jgi:hypothetical protein
MFAMLPDERSLDSPSAISFIASPKDEANRSSNWQTFQLKDRNLISEALALLEKAYKDSMQRSAVDDPISVRRWFSVDSRSDGERIVH